MIFSKQLRDFKKQILLFCLVQGLLTLFIAFYTMLYLPEVLQDAKPMPEVMVKRRPKINKTKMADITKTLASKDGETYVLFRFDKYSSGLEYNSLLDKISENGKYVYFESDYMKDEISDWFNVVDTFCWGCLKIHGKRIGYLQNATINPDLADGNVGGEDVTNIMHQRLEIEYLTLHAGFIQTMSKNDLDIPSNYTLNIELKTFLNGFNVIPRHNEVSETSAYLDKLAVLVTRFEYANFYHTTMNWYDIFLIMVLYNIGPRDLDVYWVDAHPKATLDNTWEKLYGKCTRVKALQNSLTYKHMVLNGIGPKSEINAHKQTDLPYINEYRHFVLSRYGVNPDHVINCKELRVTIIWRRSYIAHPRNPDGFVPRQIYNEEEVWETVSKALPTATVNGVQLDKLTMLEQLQWITTTDILIGMHGAGMSHILYLPKTSGVIEFFTMRTSVGNAHFRSMSKWRRLPHIVWINSSQRNEMPDHKTYIPAVALKNMLQTMKESICGIDDDLPLQSKEV